jgi:hypothetical protein
MTNIKEMTDLQISDRLSELDPMEFDLCVALKTERCALLWEKHLRNIADSAVGRGITIVRHEPWEDIAGWEIW